MSSPLVNMSTGETLDVNLEGFIDLIEKDDTIAEFKTSNQTMNQSDLDNHLQFTAYSYAYEMLYRRPPRTLRLIDFVKTKRPKIIPLEVNRENLDYIESFSFELIFEDLEITSLISRGYLFFYGRITGNVECKQKESSFATSFLKELIPSPDPAPISDEAIRKRIQAIRKSKRKIEYKRGVSSDQPVTLDDYRQCFESVHGQSYSRRESR